MSPDKAVEVLTGRPGTDVKLTSCTRAPKIPRPSDDHPGDHRRPQRLGDHRKPDDRLGLHDRQGQEDRLRPDHQLHPEHGRRAEESPRPAQGRRGKGLILDLRDDPGGLLSLGRRGLRPVPRQGRDRQHQGAEHPTQDATRPRRTAPSKTVPDGRAGQPELGLGLRDRLGRASRTTSAPRSSASGPTARARSRTSSISTAATACSS